MSLHLLNEASKEGAEKTEAGKWWNSYSLEANVFVQRVNKYFFVQYSNIISVGKAKSCLFIMNLWLWTNRIEMYSVEHVNCERLILSRPRTAHQTKRKRTEPTLAQSGMHPLEIGANRNIDPRLRWGGREKEHIMMFGLSKGRVDSRRCELLPFSTGLCKRSGAKLCAVLSSLYERHGAKEIELESRRLLSFECPSDPPNNVAHSGNLLPPRIN